MLPSVRRRWQTSRAFQPQGGQWDVDPPGLLALQKSSAHWDELSYPTKGQPTNANQVSSADVFQSHTAVSKAVGKLSSSQPVERYWLPHRRDLCQMVACPLCGGGSHEAGPWIPTALVRCGRAAVNPQGGKSHFCLQQSRVLGWVLDCHPLSQPQRSLGIWSFKNYCKRSKALGKAGLSGVFSKLFSLQPLQPLRTQGA